MNEDLKFQVTSSDGHLSISDVGADTRIDDTNMTHEFIRQAALVAHYGTLLENAQHALRIEELDFETHEAELAISIRTTYAGAGEKLTEAKLESFVKSNAVYREKKKRLLQVRHRAELLKVAAKAVDAKGSALISLAAQKRSEMEFTGMRIMERGAGRGMEKPEWIR